MKKIFTRLLIIFALFTICGCSMNSKNKITYKEDYGYEKRDNVLVNQNILHLKQVKYIMETMTKDISISIISKY